MFTSSRGHLVEVSNDSNRLKPSRDNRRGEERRGEARFAREKPRGEREASIISTPVNTVQNEFTGISSLEMYKEAGVPLL